MESSGGTVAHLNYVIKISTGCCLGVDRDTRWLDSRFRFDQPASECKKLARQELAISLYFKAQIFIRAADIMAARRCCCGRWLGSNYT